MNNQSASTSPETSPTDETPTVSVPGLGDVPSPSALREQNRSKYDTQHVAVADRCPVRGCSASGFRTFKQLRGHFGNVSDDHHRAYGLSIDDYCEDEA